MSELVDPTKIEQIVGVPRHSRIHYGRAVSNEETFYILHSQNCLESTPDLRECEFSVALDNGINEDQWSSYMDRPVMLSIANGKLWPGIVAGT